MGNPYKAGSIRAKAWERGVKDANDWYFKQYGALIATHTHYGNPTPFVITTTPVLPDAPNYATVYLPNTTSPGQKSYTSTPLAHLE